MDSFVTLNRYLDLDPITNLEILHKTEIITVNHHFITCTDIQFCELETTIKQLFLNYGQTKSPKKYITELLEHKKTHFSIIWRDRIVFFNIFLSQNLKMWLQCSNSYLLNIHTYHLDLEIDERIHTKAIFKILSYPTAKKIQHFLKKRQNYLI